MAIVASMAAVLLMSSTADADTGAQTLDFDLSAAQVRTGTQAGFEPGSTPDDQQFSVVVPEGTYRVTLRIGSRSAAANTTVKAEARRLMLRSVATRKGQAIERSFLVDVRRPTLAPPPPTAPGSTAVRIDARDRTENTWDDKLTLEFLGKPAVSHIRIEPAKAPTVYVVGDSTVADQYAEPYASWGQMLPAMFDDTLLVANHAKSGASLKSFLTDLRFEKVLANMGKGDWLLIQFGHNDQKQEWPQTYVDPEWTYPAYLKTYIAEARRRGALPILVTSPERRNFDESGHIKDTLGAYAQAVRKVAQEEGVPLVDLNRASITLYEALGPEIAPSAFAMNGEDHTHHDNYGAWLMASAVAQGLRSAAPELAVHLTTAPFDPAHPPAAANLGIVASRAAPVAKPAGN